MSNDLKIDGYSFVYIYHTWKKVGILATDCRRQGPKMPKLAQNQRKKRCKISIAILVPVVFRIFPGIFKHKDIPKSETQFVLLLRGGEIFAKIADRSYTLTEQKVQSARDAMGGGVGVSGASPLPHFKLWLRNCRKYMHNAFYA